MDSAIHRLNNWGQVNKYVNVRNCERMRLSFPVSHRDLSKQDGTRTKVAHDRECKIFRDLFRQSAVLSLPAVLLRKVPLLRRGQPRSQGLSSLPPLSFSQRQWRQRRETLGTRLRRGEAWKFDLKAPKMTAVATHIFCYPHHPTKLFSLN